MAQNNAYKGATALLENDDIGQLCDLILAKLKEEILGRPPSKQLILTKSANSLLPYGEKQILLEVRYSEYH